MRLALVTHRFEKGGGHARVNYEIARAAIQRGHDVHLVACDAAPELAESGSLERISWSSLPSQLVRNVVFAKRSARWLRQHSRSLDVVHLNGFVTSFAGDINTCHFVHGAWLRSPLRRTAKQRHPIDMYHWLYTSLNARWEARAYRDSGIVVAVSERVKGQLTAIGVPAAKIRVVMNGVDPDEFYPTLRKPGTAREEPVALFAGDIRTPLKNLDTVLRALARVSCLQLAVAGNVTRSPFPQLAAEIGVADRVHFLGYRRDMAEVMRTADFFVFPSRSEACPLVLFEAMASGLPVVIASTVGASEVVGPDAGYVLPDPEDVEALAAVMRELAFDSARRRAVGEAARAVAERHTWSEMAEAYLRLYEEVAGREPRAMH